MPAHPTICVAVFAAANSPLNRFATSNAASKLPELAQAQRPYDHSIGKYPAVEDEANSPQLEADAHRASANVASEVPSQCGRPQTSTLGIRSSEIGFLTDRMGLEDF